MTPLTAAPRWVKAMAVDGSNHVRATLASGPAATFPAAGPVPSAARAMAASSPARGRSPMGADGDTGPGVPTATLGCDVRATHLPGTHHQTVGQRAVAPGGRPGMRRPPGGPQPGVP